MTNELHPGEVLTAETVGLLKAIEVSSASMDRPECRDHHRIARNTCNKALLALSASDEGRSSAHPQEASSVPGEGGAVRDLLAVLENVRDGMEASGGWDGDEELFAEVTTALNKHATHPAREDGPAGQAMVPVDLLNEAAGVLDCEGYGPLSLSLLNCLPSGPAAPTKEPA